MSKTVISYHRYNLLLYFITDTGRPQVKKAACCYIGGNMDKAEFDFLSKSIQAEYMERMNAAVLAYAFDEPPGETSKDSCWMNYAAAAALLRALEETAPDKATRESLLQWAIKDITTRLLLFVGYETAKTVAKVTAELLASVPTPETLTAGSIKKSVHMIPKAVNVLPKIPIAPKEEPAATAAVTVAKSRGKEAAVYVGLRAELAPIAPRLTVFDLSVMQAAASIYASGTQTFSSNQLYRALTGADAHTRITSKATLEAVKKSLDTLQATIITIDAEQQAALRGYKGYAWNKSTFKGYMLPMTKLETAYYSGNKLAASCDCWRILATPPALEYATTIKQVATIPQEVKRLPKGVSATVNNICIRDTLLYYIHLNRGKGVKLNYSTLFEAAGVDTSDRRIYHKMKKAADSLLKHWQEIGFITDQTDVIESYPNDTIYIS